MSSHVQIVYISSTRPGCPIHVQYMSTRVPTPHVALVCDRLHRGFDQSMLQKC